MEACRELDIDNRHFRVSRFTALIGSRILNILLAAMFKAQTGDSGTAPNPEDLSPEDANALVSSMWIAVGSGLDTVTYTEIQRYCLQVCSIYATDASDAPPIPLVSTNNRWAVKELEHDFATVNRLITEALQFNLSPFFIESALKQAESARAQASNPSLSLT